MHYFAVDTIKHERQFLDELLSNIHDPVSTIQL